MNDVKLVDHAGWLRTESPSSPDVLRDSQGQVYDAFDTEDDVSPQEALLFEEEEPASSLFDRDKTTGRIRWRR